MWLNAYLMSDTIVISGDGAFYTFQGEGPTVGEQAVFLRVNECNLSCKYCDTPYTWNQTDPGYQERRKLTVDEVLKLVLEVNAGRCKRLVLTGGEPLLQQRTLAELCCRPELAEWVVEIETNGTIFPDLFLGRANLQINCSPKLSNSGIFRGKRINQSVLERLSRTPGVVFKFVVSEKSHVEEIAEDFFPLIGDFPRDRIFLSPEGIDVDTLDTVLAKILPIALQYGFSVSDRKHIRVYGNRRGV